MCQISKSLLCIEYCSLLYIESIIALYIKKQKHPVFPFTGIFCQEWWILHPLNKEACMLVEHSTTKKISYTQGDGQMQSDQVEGSPFAKMNSSSHLPVINVQDSIKFVSASKMRGRLHINSGP